jgi:hypothetical protein
MRERLEQRLTELRKEYQEGQRAISELKSRLAALRTTVLRISGAIQVLEEELAGSAADRGLWKDPTRVRDNGLNLVGVEIPEE